MKAVLQIALGIIAAIGGFVDIGDLVFNVQAGAIFGYDLLWVLPIGVLGIGVYAEMCGRVAAVTKRPVFDVIRERLGYGAGLVTLVASQVVNLLTVTAEVGGVAIVLQLLFDAPFSLFALVAAAALAVIVWVLPFGGIERLFGYGGLLLFVFVAAALKLGPDWQAFGQGFVPEAPSSTLYWYFVVGVIAAALMPYEVYFYSSGAVEEGWGPKDLRINRLNVLIGYTVGGVIAGALMVVAAELFQPAGVDPGSLGTVALAAQVPYGEIGLLVALLGMLAAIGGAAVDASLSGAYNLAQFLGWEWGKHRRPREAPRFTITWLLFLGAAFALVMTGVDPVDVTEYSVIFSVVALPLTYLPVLLIARDRTFMGEHANGRISTALGWVYMVVIVTLAIAAIPLLLATNAGGG
ncbi:NRAMP family divalent metal transporter [Patulibacter defluvii]|uniref:NRAMP family divalent metal transporter n=1 Tax=Patulibacter defluvii TaxID=3095358 RepID=UPI002A764AAF|nr:divalent metal cation transporter [Patulibacter sp. DM4]